MFQDGSNDTKYPETNAEHRSAANDCHFNNTAFERSPYVSPLIDNEEEEDDEVDVCFVLLLGQNTWLVELFRGRSSESAWPVTRFSSPRDSNIPQEKFCGWGLATPHSQGNVTRVLE